MENIVIKYLEKYVNFLIIKGLINPDNRKTLEKVMKNNNSNNDFSFLIDFINTMLSNKINHLSKFLVLL